MLLAEDMIRNFGGVWNSSPAIGGAPSSSATRRICGFAFGFTQISPYSETSHIPGTLSAIAKGGDK